MAWVDDAMKRAEAATPGPWFRHSEGWILEEKDRDKDIINDEPDPVVGMWVEDTELRIAPNDGEFIAAARTDLPHALACLREAVALLTFAEAASPLTECQDPDRARDWQTRKRALLAAVGRGPKEGT